MSNEASSSDEAIEYHGEPKERRPALIVLLSILCPGLGYMYTGQMLKGVTVNLLFLLGLEAFIIIFSTLKFFPLLPMLVLLLAWGVFTLFVIFDALRTARRDETYLLKGYNHWTLYAVVFLLTYVVPMYATQHFVSRYLITFEPIESSAMFPTLQTGDLALIDLSAFRDVAPERGELVAVTAPETGETVVLRVVGVENDSIRIEGETVFVNNEPLGRSKLSSQELRVPSLDGEGDLLAMVEENNGNRYVISVSPKAFIAHSMPPTKLSANEFFVLADNRSQVPANGEKKIRDSRDFGAVTLNEIEGEPLYIAWSWGPAGDTRLERVGLKTQ